MTLADADTNKAIYTSLHDEIISKRFEAEYSIRRYAHRGQYGIFLELIPPGSTVLDAGCGEGVLSVMLAKHGCKVTGTDISEPNIVSAKAYAQAQGVEVEFLLADVERMPAADKSFDYVVSSHVLEHVPDFAQGAAELSRIARKQVFIAIPTCLSLGACALLGGDKYWTLSRKSIYAVPYGLLRVLWALITNQEGVNEGYEGRMELIHIWRFPWKGKKRIEQGKLKVVAYAGSAYVFPYLPFLIPISRIFDRMKWWRVIRNFGHGTTYVCVPQAS